MLAIAGVTDRFLMFHHPTDCFVINLMLIKLMLLFYKDVYVLHILDLCILLSEYYNCILFLYHNSNFYRQAKLFLIGYHNQNYATLSATLIPGFVATVVVLMTAKLFFVATIKNIGKTRNHGNELVSECYHICAFCIAERESNTFLSFYSLSGHFSESLSSINR